MPNTKTRYVVAEDQRSATPNPIPQRELTAPVGRPPLAHITRPLRGLSRRCEERTPPGLKSPSPPALWKERTATRRQNLLRPLLVRIGIGPFAGLHHAALTAPGPRWHSCGTHHGNAQCASANPR